MRKLLLMGLMLWGSANAQKMLPCSPTAQFRVKSVFFDEGKVMAAALVSKPAVFPKPASTSETTLPYRMTCPGFTASASLHDFTLSGPVAATWPRLLSADKDGDPDTAGYTRGKINLLFYGYFEYESIREDWNQASIYLSFKSGRLTVESESYPQIFFKNDIIAARINGGKLQPVWFEKKLTPLRYGSRDVIELYVKGEMEDLGTPPLTYVKVDLKRGLIQFRDNVPFPSK